MHRCDLSPLSGSSHRGCRGESQRSCALLDALLNILSHRHVVISSCYYSNCAFREIPENQHALQRMTGDAELFAVIGQQIMEGFLTVIDAIFGILFDLADGPIPDTCQLEQPGVKLTFLRCSET